MIWHIGNALKRLRRRWIARKPKATAKRPKPRLSWRDRLACAEQISTFTEEDKRLARNWRRGPVGEWMHTENLGQNDRLLVWASRFARAVENNDIPDGFKVYGWIHQEARHRELIIKPGIWIGPSGT